MTDLYKRYLRMHKGYLEGAPGAQKALERIIDTLEENRKKKILCSCGTGVASCSFISSEIGKLLKENGIDAEIIDDDSTANYSIVICRA